MKLLKAVLRFFAILLVLFAGLAANAFATGDKALTPIVQNDIAIEPASPGPGQAHRFHVAFVLPLRSPTLAQTTAAVRDGFMAVLRSQHYQGDQIALEIVETSDSVVNHLIQFGRVQPNNYPIIGPLTLTASAALAPVVTQTTLALAPADRGRIGVAGKVTNTAFAPMTAMGLSIEEEARQMADWASSQEEHGKAWVMSTDVSWQQRAANAFVQQLGRQRTHFSSEGQAGSLSIHLDSGNTVRFARRLTSAVHEDGRVIVWLEG